MFWILIIWGFRVSREMRKKDFVRVERGWGRRVFWVFIRKVSIVCWCGYCRERNVVVFVIGCFLEIEFYWILGKGGERLIVFNFLIFYVILLWLIIFKIIMLVSIYCRV